MRRAARRRRMATTVRRARTRPRHSGRPHRAAWRDEEVTEPPGEVEISTSGQGRQVRPERGQEARER